MVGFLLSQKNIDYENAYYKMVLERRVKAYEVMEWFILHIKIATLDETNKPYHRLFAEELKS